MPRQNWLFYFLMQVFICEHLCTCNYILTAKVVNEIVDMAKASKTKGNMIDTADMVIRLEQVSTDFHSMHKRLNKAILNNTGSKLITQTNKLFEYIGDVQRQYTVFVDIFFNNNNYTDDQLEQFSNTSQNTTFSSSIRLDLKTSIEKMYETLVGLDLEKESIVTMIASEFSSSTTICINGHTPQLLIRDIYGMATVTHTKGLLMLLYALRFREQIQQKNYGYDRQKMIDDYYSTIVTTSEKVNRAMSVSSREFWKCDPSEHKQGETFLELDPIFQGYFVFETDTYRNPFSTLFTNCNKISNGRLICESNHCTAQPIIKRCRGILRDCQFISNSMQLCHADEHSKRKYEWMETNEGVVYGHKQKTCNSYMQNLHSIWPLDICVCTCESQSRESDRYFSLLDVTSDVNQNKVVTGTRIAKENHVFHIQIQEGILGENGTITNTDNEWKPIRTTANSKYLANLVPTYPDWPNNNNSIVSIYTVRQDNNIVFLDDLEDQEDKLVTGLRFQQIGSCLRLEVQTTSFNYSTGQLDKEKSSWLANSNGVEKRLELVLSEPDESIRASPQSDVFSQNNQYIRFRMSDLEKDLGQNTVPFIDSQEVTMNPPLPLSGAGIFHKGKKNYGGFLALKLIHIDFSAPV